MMEKCKEKFSRWIYFPHMLFLLDVLPKNLSDGILGIEYYLKEPEMYALGEYAPKIDTDCINHHDDSYSNEDDDFYEEEETSQNVSDLSNHEIKNDNIINNDDNFDAEIIYFADPIEEIDETVDTNYDENVQIIPSTTTTQQKLDQNEIINNTPPLFNINSEYTFLMSLTPFLKLITDHRKIAVRINLQQIFIDENIDYDTWTNNTRDIDTNFFNPNDYDERFLISLLPFINSIPIYNKLKIRSKIMEIFHNELNNEI